MSNYFIQSDLEIYNLLTEIKNNTDSHSLFSRLGDTSFDTAVEKSISLGYIQGAYPARVASGKLTLDLGYNFGLTSTGLKFLENFKK